ncbi:hypothetical protein BN85400480 [Alteracholeplasma palmae J233]|uniref:Uncharacterized protein n=1 Tax=Alteracholeplasma palmae (strain ATCC 49389 / J233) TaxID=1318466 RepID=U4KN77_ALTPJ|nr:hypothetical protein BN85400480 [Alteracholeplasma palmae J233]
MIKSRRLLYCLIPFFLLSTAHFISLLLMVSYNVASVYRVINVVIWAAEGYFILIILFLSRKKITNFFKRTNLNDSNLEREK